MCLCPQVPQEGGLARARLAGQKDVALSILCVFVRQVKFWILHFLFSLKSVRIDHEYLFFLENTKLSKQTKCLRDKDFIESIFAFFEFFVF